MLVCICHLSQHHIHHLWAVIVRSIVRQSQSHRQLFWLQLTTVRIPFHLIYILSDSHSHFFIDFVFFSYFAHASPGSHQCSAELTPLIGRSSSTGGSIYPKQATSKHLLGDISPYRELDVLSLQMTEQAIN